MTGHSSLTTRRDPTRKMMEAAIGLTVQEIQHAIDALTPAELEELYSWLDHHHPQPIDERLQSDLAAGRLDKAIRRALDDEKNTRRFGQLVL